MLAPKKITATINPKDFPKNKSAATEGKSGAAAP